MATHRTPYRSRAWFDTPELYGWLRQAAFRAEGFGKPAYEGRPLIGICNSWSELTHCNAHLRQLAEAVKRGVWQAGGFPLEFPVMSLGEYNMRPTTMPVPQPDEHGRGGVHHRQPARRRGAVGRLRQDDAGAADGRGERRRAGHHGHRRPAAQGQLAR